MRAMFEIRTHGREERGVLTSARLLSVISARELFG